MPSRTTAASANRRRRRPEAFAAALLAGCALTSARPPDLPPLPPDAAGAVLEAEQRLTVAGDGLDLTLQCFVKLTPARLGLRCFNAQGAEAVSVEHGDGMAPDPAAPAARMLRDLQWMAWPLGALNGAAAGTPWRFESPAPGQRTVWYDDRLVAEVRIDGASAWDGRVTLRHRGERYALSLTSRRLESRP